MVRIVPVIDLIPISVSLCQGVFCPYIVQYHRLVEHTVLVDVFQRRFVLAHIQRDMTQVDLFVFPEHQAGTYRACGIPEPNGLNDLIGSSYSGGHHELETYTDGCIELEGVAVRSVILRFDGIVRPVIAECLDQGPRYGTANRCPRTAPGATPASAGCLKQCKSQNAELVMSFHDRPLEQLG